MKGKRVHQSEVLETMTLAFLNMGETTERAERLARNKIKDILWEEVLNIEEERDGVRGRKSR